MQRNYRGGYYRINGTKHTVPSDTPTHSPGTVSDKTANTAIGYRKRLENENIALITELTKELMSKIDNR